MPTYPQDWTPDEIARFQFFLEHQVVHIVINWYMFGTEVADVFWDEIEALRFATQHELPKGVNRRSIIKVKVK